MAVHRLPGSAEGQEDRGSQGGRARGDQDSGTTCGGRRDCVGAASPFGKLPLTEIKPAQVRAFIAQKLNAKASRNTVKNMAATLRAVLYQAQQVDELIPSNPAARFGKFFDARHDAREHVVVLEPEDVARVLKSATKWYADHELAVRMLFYTGMREGEMLGLRWEDVDWQRHLVDLRRTVAFRQHRLIVNTPKSGKLRTIDIPAALTASLRELHSIRIAAWSPWQSDLPNPVHVLRC